MDENFAVPQPKSKQFWTQRVLKLMELWQMPERDGTIPVLFVDELAATFFVSSVVALVYQAYREGIRFEQKRRKAKAVLKHKLKEAERERCSTAKKS